jgi:hypothetical protein
MQTDPFYFVQTDLFLMNADISNLIEAGRFILLESDRSVPQRRSKQIHYATGRNSSSILRKPGGFIQLDTLTEDLFHYRADDSVPPQEDISITL